MVEILIKKGVKIPCPLSVEIGPDVNPDSIAPGVTIHSGCKIYGSETSIGPGCILGAEAPATIVDCQLGRSIGLAGGYFSGAVFLDNAGLGSSAHIREGTILEEQANGAHAVGLKQTILLPFVTLGSLINFCDILMAGGTNRRNHSEVGSSYIHFNYSPHQDKATASLLGDVPRGVLLDQPPIFLGGQGGLVGPCRIAYGTVIPAGLIYRKDISTPMKLHVPPPHKGMTVDFQSGVYKSIQRIVRNNLIYIGNIRALEAWYGQVRSRFLRDEYDRACFEGAKRNLILAVNERIERLDQLAGKMAFSVMELSKIHGDAAPFAQEQQNFAREWEKKRTTLEKRAEPGDCPELLGELESTSDKNYIDTVQSLSRPAKDAVSRWLQAIVDETAGRLLF